MPLLPEQRRIFGARGHEETKDKKKGQETRDLPMHQWGWYLGCRSRHPRLRHCFSGIPDTTINGRRGEFGARDQEEIKARRRRNQSADRRPHIWERKYENCRNGHQRRLKPQPRAVTSARARPREEPIETTQRIHQRCEHPHAPTRDILQHTRIPNPPEQELRDQPPPRRHSPCHFWPARVPPLRATTAQLAPTLFLGT